MIVCVAEKPSVASEIAKILGAKTKKDGYYEGNGYQVTWTFGHLCQLKAPDAYYPQWKRWDIDILPMIPPRYEVELINNPGIIAYLTDVCAGARPLVGRQLHKSKRVFDNSKVTDHHAIIPTGDTRNYASLNDYERKVYDLIVRRFCAVFYPAYEYAQTTVIAAAGTLTFKATGRTILSEG